MDSERPAPPTQERRVHRPFYLVAAMVLVWIAGVEIFLDAAKIATVLRSGALPDVETVVRAGGVDSYSLVGQVLMAARLTVMGSVPHLAFPLAVARAILACTLIFASTTVLLGRPTARVFALQSLGANAIFAIIEYALLKQVRGTYIDMAARGAALINDPTSSLSLPEFAHLIGYWLERVIFAARLGVPFAAALALTTQRTKVFFAEAAAAAESAEEEP
ncbi:MAG: hypothetical protein IPK82_21255 [Polyangiaceae bacterium]|nr:hypothetical protein [Polyangiaceae bacterium]